MVQWLKQISPRMRAGLAISLLLHVVLIGWGLVSFAAKPLASMQGEVVDVISDKEFDQLMKGQKKAPKSPAPKPLAEKIGETKPADDLKAKVSEKQEIVKTADAETPPEPKPEKKEAKPEPEKKVDPIAEALKKDEQKKKEEPKKEEAKKEEPKKVEPKPKPQPKFDPAKFAALLDKRAPQRQVASADSINTEASLGASTASAATLSQSEMAAMRARLMSLWNLPVGVKNPDELNIRIAIKLKRDGTLAEAPQVLSSGRGAAFEAARDSAIRALLQGQPYDMLRPHTYEVWNDMEVVFDAREWFAMTQR